MVSALERFHCMKKLCRKSWKRNGKIRKKFIKSMWNIHDSQEYSQFVSFYLWLKFPPVFLIYIYFPGWGGYFWQKHLPFGARKNPSHPELQKAKTISIDAISMFQWRCSLQKEGGVLFMQKKDTFPPKNRQEPFPMRLSKKAIHCLIFIYIWLGFS